MGFFFCSVIVGFRISKMYNCKKKTNILELSLQYSFEKVPPVWIHNLVIDTEAKISCLDVNMQDTYRYPVC